MKLDDTTIKEIRNLRRNGEPIKRIASRLDCSPSTAKKYTNGLKIVNTTRYRNIINQTKKNNAYKASKAAQTKWHQNRESVKQQARLEWSKTKQNPLLLALVALYAGEGYKGTAKYISISNNNPKIIKLAFKALRYLDPNVLITATITYYKSHNKKLCKDHWIQLFDSNVKIVMRKNTDSRSKDLVVPHPRCPYGRCDLRYSKFDTYWKIMQWIDCLLE